jgi:hypothetical protein
MQTYKNMEHYCFAMSNHQFQMYYEWSKFDTLRTMVESDNATSYLRIDTGFFCAKKFSFLESQIYEICCQKKSDFNKVQVGRFVPR